MRHLDHSARAPYRQNSPTGSAEFRDGQRLAPTTEREQRFELRAPDLAHRLGLISVERAVRRYQADRAE
jgi:hypothetical protein